jgi:hypothetical protein
MTPVSVIEERRPLTQNSWRALLLVVPLFLLAACLPLSSKPKELLAVAPLFFLVGYAFIAMYACWRKVRIDHAGFSIEHGPIPCGAQDFAASSSRVRHLYPRHLPVLVNRHELQHQYFASVELDDGYCLDLRGPYSNWDEALAACVEVGTLWRLREVAAGRSGLGSSDRRRLYRLTGIWVGAFLAAFLWIPLILA